MDFDKEIGETLESVLKIIACKNGISAEEMALLTNEHSMVAVEHFYSLQRRGYLFCNTLSGDIISKHDKFRITDEGKNYFEIRKRIWNQFLKKSVYVPIVVALLTTLITNLVTIWLKSL